MSARRWLVLGLVAFAAAWPTTGGWFFVLAVVAILAASILPLATDGAAIVVLAGLLSLPVLALPGALVGALAGLRGWRLLPPAVGSVIGGSLALVVGVGTVSFFALALVGVTAGNLLGLLVAVGRRRGPQPAR